MSTLRSAIFAFVLALAFIGATSARANPELGPISLTNPDGQAITLEKLDVRVAVHGCLSLVEMEMVFANPQPREMEGRFLCVLPSGAAISRFAKEVDGRLMEGEVVERQKAQKIFNQILPTMRDPALLEHDQGNRFSVRVYPVPASGKVRLLLSYSRLLPLLHGERKLTIPMAGTPRIGQFTFNVVGRLLPGQTATSQILEKAQPIKGELSSANYSAKDFKIERDIEMTFRLPSDAKKSGESVQAYNAGYFQMLCYRPEISPPAKPEPARDWTVYVDTSASGADSEEFRLRTIGALAGRMQENKRTLQAFAFDLETAPLPASGIVAALRSRHALGATNLAKALKHVGEQARGARTAQCFVLVTDGIATTGPRDARALLDALGAWPERHVLHALVLGSVQDDTMLNAIVEKTGGRVVRAPMTDYPEESAEQIVAELRKPLGRTYEIQDEGVRWTFPKIFRDVQPGEELIAFSSLRYVGSSKPKIVARNGKTNLAPPVALNFKPEPLAEFEPLLTREACRALLARLEEEESKEEKPELRAQYHKMRLNISRNSRVLCPLTSLLVLETEWDYQANEIMRFGLADVLTVGKQGVEMKMLFDGETAERLKTMRQAAQKREDARADAERAADEEKERLLKQLTEGTKVQDFGLTDNGQITESKASKPVKPRTPPIAAQPLTLAEQSGVGALQVNIPMPALAAVKNLPPGSATSTPTSLEREQPYLPGAASSEWEEQAADENVSQAPEGWHKQVAKGTKDTELELANLRAQATAKPRNRTFRNAYAQGLERAGAWKELHALALDWLPYDPQNVQVYEYLGVSATKLNDMPTALRAFTSIGEIAPNRAALLGRAGWLLLANGKYELAAEQFREAIKNRGDDCNLYRGLALCAWMQKDYKTAAAVFEDALKKDFGRRGDDAHRALSEELGFVFRAMLANDKLSADEAGRIKARAKAAEVDLARTDALRVTLCWETDATDVELHVVDPKGEQCFSGANGRGNTASGLELYATRVIGLGPKIIRAEKTIPGTYRLGVNYFRTGPMGISRGVVVVLKAANGVAEPLTLLPFALVPALGSMRHVGDVKFE